MQLKSGTLLQNGKYRIEKVLGQGGFGITYLAVQTALDRKVAIKEFFMKDYCNRDSDTSHVSVPSIGSKELVFKFRNKFIREAKMIAAMENPHIVTIYEVFEENGTAYYVMQYVEGGSLESKVPMKPDEAEIYIRQIADALDYCHDQKILHLDVKPSNVMLNKGKAVLIDFGISKHYDEGGGQTSSTPVGISKGYAPLEQYDRGDISSFTPCTDIYSLGATFYKLLTGQTPPEANKVNEEGIHIPDNIPMNQRQAITFAMQPKRKDRPQSIDEFLKLLDGDAKKEKKESLWKKWMRRKKDIVEEQSDIIVTVDEDDPEPRKNLIPILLAVILCIVGIVFVINITDNNDKYNDLYNKGIRYIEAKSYDSAMNEFDKAMIYKDNHVCLFVEDAAEMYDSLGDMTRDKKSYLTMIEEGDSLAKAMKYDAAISKYEEAKRIENKYAGTEFSQEFNEDAGNKIVIVNDKRSLHTTMLRNKNSYLALINEGDKLLSEKKYDAAISKYEEAKKYEEKYAGTEFSQEFKEDASAKIRAAEETERRYKEQQEREAAVKAEAERLEKEKRERETAAAAEAARLEKERKEREAAEQQAFYNRTHGSINGHEWVDLGLPSGLKWATCNVGAESPEDYGDYYAWGETSTKSSYTENNSKTYGKSYSDIGSRSQYDAARARWGGTWKMPTRAECQELVYRCTWTWTTQGGKNGYKVTGPNGNSIFLPAAGYRNGSSLTFAEEIGFCLSSTPDERYSGGAYCLIFGVLNQDVEWTYRYSGQSVRPVSE